MACCPVDGEPLVSTFERPFKVFVCVVCDRWYEFLQPVGKPDAPDLQARHDELKALYDLARAERSRAAGVE